mmetsp:Transcript_37816/g.65944  ORF Transcript_37816/g.65944 Transcript_37816/m.65944 type:complete len:101 (-) Transcript_37816:678-980(-)
MLIKYLVAAIYEVVNHFNFDFCVASSCPNDCGCGSRCLGPCVSVSVSGSGNGFGCGYLSALRACAPKVPGAAAAWRERLGLAPLGKQPPASHAHRTSSLS